MTFFKVLTLRFSVPDYNKEFEKWKSQNEISNKVYMRL